ncbi:MAG: hypothetical protein AB7O66_21060 [Limisphaerales bacterium]
MTDSAHESPPPVAPATDAYRIRGGDRREYGPVDAAQILEWIRSGRADRDTPIRDEQSTAWQRLEARPEFARSLPPPHPRGLRLQGFSFPESLPFASELRSRPLKVHVLDAFASGAALVFRQPRAVAGAFAIAFVIVAGLLALGFIPKAALAALPLAVCAGATLLAGLALLAVRAWRGHPVRVRDAFAGFRSRLLPLLLTTWVLLAWVAGAVVPGLVLIGLGISEGDTAQDLTPKAAGLLFSGAALIPVLGLLPLTCWGFAPTLVIERGIGPLEALRLSRQITLRHPIRNYLFTAASAVLVILGLLLGGVGLLLTGPWVLGARACLHDTLFGPSHAPPASAT